MKADFILKETGEPVSFDYVVGCGGVTFSNPGTTPTAFITHHPMIMFEPVGDGHVLGLVTIDMCEDWKWEPIKHGPQAGESRIPDDLRPLAIWIEDVNDLSFGWGYKTDDAYDSPLAKIEFVESSVTKTDEAAWRAWREKAKADYEQIGALPGPWGYNYTHEPVEVQQEARSRGAGFGLVDPTCRAQGRVPVDPAILSDVLDETDAPQDRFLIAYWKQYSAFERVSNSYAEQHNGVSLKAFINQDSYFLGTLARTGGGHIIPWKEPDKSGFHYSDVFPLIPRSRFPQPDQPKMYARGIDTSPSRKGFGACSSIQREIDIVGRPESETFEQSDVAAPPEERAQNHKFYVGDEFAGYDPQWILQKPNYVIDRRGYVYVPQK
ncbi:hypothetical protein [Henriciella aquimarina]|uniref:hypothetical protein n=1 Tax=Henriciella aquimarina TaxID=545261 RepID=UPI0009FFB582|nr:hypothetical protein [Henriciella aquimarina]